MNPLFPQMKPLEKQITSEIRYWLTLKHIWHYKNFQGLGCMKGVADIIGIWKGRYLAIEVKRPGNGPTDAQRDFLDRVNREGGVGFVAHSVEEVMQRLG